MIWLLLLKIIHVLANFFSLSDTFRIFSLFRFIATLREIKILPVNSTI